MEGLGHEGKRDKGRWEEVDMLERRMADWCEESENSSEAVSSVWTGSDRP